MRNIITILLVAISFVSLAQEERKVLLIGIDGCRGDALQAANTPAIDVLLANATYSYEATTQFPTYSGPGWSSMLTGVWNPKHGVTDNSFVGSNFEDYPHFFTLIKSVEPWRYVASVCHWGPINDNITSDADYSANVNSMQDAEDLAIAQVQLDELDVLFVHLDDVDIAGHATGYSVDSPVYMQAIEAADSHVGAIMTALQQRPNYANEEWLIALSTDHGGLGFSHGGASIEERTIFTIFSGDNFPNEEIVAEYSSIESDASNALNLNSVNVYGTLDHPVYEFEDNEDFTIEFRLKTNGWTGDPSIISDKDWNSGYNPGFVFALKTDEQTWKFNLGDDDERIDLDGGIVNDGEWHHLAVSVDRDGEIRLFQDGEVLAVTTESLVESIISGFPIAVGQDGTMSYAFDFDGWIDELRIWNAALETSELQDWSCDNLTTSHPNYDDLIGYWKMEEIADLHIDGTDPNNQVDLVLVNGPYISSEGPMTCITLVNPAPVMVDIVPTMLTHMCINIEDDWSIDGETIGIEFADCANSIQENDQESFYIYPNPSGSERSVFWNKRWDGSFEVYDLEGKLVRSHQVVSSYSGLVLNLDPGAYIYKIISDDELSGFSRPLIISH